MTPTPDTMENEKTGGPAYPSANDVRIDTPQGAMGTGGHSGMTLLDHFAGLSMAHLADGGGYSKDYIEAHMGKPMPSWRDPEHITYTAAFNAKMKYAEAAAMIAERNRLMNP